MCPGCHYGALDIVAIAPAVVDGVRRREGDAFCREQQTRQQTRILGAGSPPLAAGVHCELSLDLVPGLSVNDGLMLAFVALAPMWDAADIDRVGDNEIEVAAAERCSPTLPSIKERA